MFQWADFIAVATALSTATDEASLRSSVSRAYYAAFHSARTYVRNQGAPLSRHGQIHQDVHDALVRGQRHEKSAAIHLGRLKQARTAADYELSSTNWNQQASTCLRWAQAVLDLLKPEPPGPTV
jgi:uncharacterized protein (UPF0332 family)